ncbi:RICIN domain-containing protein [Streptomyces sp. MMS24-I2-30]|uniref:RICIN domain-containing protein n=1 Tax=Streptomyces sp. MMS24-I2-30 TaxID=3351564 RepID=UPI003896DAFF
MAMTRQLRRLAVLGAVATFAAGAAVGTPASAAAASAPSPHVVPLSFHAGEFELMSDLPSHRCVGINASRQAGLWNCAGGNDQVWSLANGDNQGNLQLENRNGQCLGVASAGTRNGSRVVAGSCHADHPDQFWFGLQYRDDPSSILNWHAGLELAVSGGADINGQPVILWSHTTNPDHRWTLNNYF